MILGNFKPRFTDIILGLIVSIFIVSSGQTQFFEWIITGILIAGVVWVTWMHIYAAFEIKKIALILALLSLIQNIIISVVVGIIYNSNI